MICSVSLRHPLPEPLLVAVLGLEGQLHNPSSCDDCSVEQVSVLLHMAHNLERT